MAIINRNTLLTNISNNAKWSFNPLFDRTKAQPLDSSSIVGSLSDLNEYAENNSVAYPGQIVTVVSDNKVTPYYINLDGSVSEVGSHIGENATFDGSISANSLTVQKHIKSSTFETKDNGIYVEGQIYLNGSEFNTNVRGDWLVTDVNSPAFILNKPQIVQADWEMEDENDPSFIKNKPDVFGMNLPVTTTDEALEIERGNLTLTDPTSNEKVTLTIDDIKKLQLLLENNSALVSGMSSSIIDGDTIQFSVMDEIPDVATAYSLNETEVQSESGGKNYSSIPIIVTDTNFEVQREVLTLSNGSSRASISIEDIKLLHILIENNSALFDSLNIEREDDSIIFSQN